MKGYETVGKQGQDIWMTTLTDMQPGELADPEMEPAAKPPSGPLVVLLQATVAAVAGGLSVLAWLLILD